MFTLAPLTLLAWPSDAVCSQPPWHSVDKLVSAYQGSTCAMSYTETGAYMRNKVSLCGGS